MVKDEREAHFPSFAVMIDDGESLCVKDRIFEENRCASTKDVLIICDEEISRI